VFVLTFGDIRLTPQRRPWLRGKEKGPGQPATNRSKQAGMFQKTIIVLLVGLALASVCLAEAQQQAKVAKIGWLVTGSASGPRSLFPGVQKELRALGYLEGKNIAIEFRSTERP
jgi:hypothetical protein